MFTLRYNFIDHCLFNIKLSTIYCLCSTYCLICHCAPQPLNLLTTSLFRRLFATLVQPNLSIKITLSSTYFQIVIISHNPPFQRSILDCFFFYILYFADNLIFSLLIIIGMDETTFLLSKDVSFFPPFIDNR